MYRTCIFCSAALGANESIERFPVGKSLAFDAEKGRLWAVCPKCARWNLAPIEERWEAIEEAERLFRDARLRVQNQSVGLTRLRDGTRLIRIGQALPGELAAWRYGREMRRRLMRARLDRAAESVPPLAYLAGLAWLPVLVVAAPLITARMMYREVDSYRRADRVAHRVPASDSPTGEAMHLRWRDLALIRTALGDGGRLELEVIQSREMWAGSSPVVLAGAAAAAVLGKALVQINGAGAPAGELDTAVRRLTDAGGAESFLRRLAAEGYGLEVPGLQYGQMFATFAPSARKARLRAREERGRRPLSLMRGNPGGALALEMALHEETERRALEGELAMLEGMWRQAEEIAAIADRLPELPPPDPPRLNPGR